MNILFASSEVAPFAKTGGLADVSESLPKALSAISCSLRVVMPFYKSVRIMNLDPNPFSSGGFSFLKHEKDGIDYIFVVNDRYYKRDNFYSEPEGDYPDNHLRFSYFSRAIAVLAGCGNGFKPDIIHLNEWQTGLVPLYLMMRKNGTKTLFTIHNIGYQGLCSRQALFRLGIPRRFYNMNGIEYYGKISFLKAGIVYASAVSTVSKKYSEEILTPEFGSGLDGILTTRLPNVYGILNGVDYSNWDPAADVHITQNYGPENIEKKVDCKKDLMKAVNFPSEASGRPLMGVISRLAEQKGIDLIVDGAKEIIDLGANIVILGTGDTKYNKLCRDIAVRYPAYISSHIKFDNTLAHKIEAGSDMFLMPSRYEPCGLNQLYSLRYGTVPIVRATGGLDDTITDIYSDPERGNGIKFSSATKEGLVDAVSRAVRLYKDKEKWQALVKRIMKLDFSWEKSALRYKDLYSKLLAS